MTTTQTKHTPGPWVLAEGYERSDTSRHFVWSDAETPEEREDASRYCIATVEPREHGETLDANARLIAAAPDLLEACKAALSELLRVSPSQASPIVRAAIAKAEGK